MFTSTEVTEMIVYDHWSDMPSEAWRWNNFSPDEPALACSCCGEFVLDEAAMDRLQATRDLLTRPLRINSGHRCPIHNARVGGAPLSQHKLGIAFDISLAGHEPRDLLDACQQAGFTTFGFYGSFLHTDTRPGRRWFKRGTEKMELLTGLVGGIASVASGGLFGLLGSVLSVGAKWLQERQRQAWETKKWDHESRMLKLQMQARAAETEQELAIVSQTGAWEGLATSTRADSALTKNVHAWVNDVRALFRPVLTAGLVALVYLMFRDLLAGLGTEQSVLGAVLTEAEVNDILRYVVYSMVFAASTAITWWFGDRAFTPPSMKGR